MERYRIIYVWKIIEGIAPNVGIENHMSTRHGRLCKIPQINLRVTGTISIRTIREGIASRLGVLSSSTVSQQTFAA